MRKLVGLAGILVPALAGAQPGNYAAPPPPPPPPTQPQPAPAVEPESKVRLEVAIVAASPRGDWEDQLQAETSPGFQVQVGFTVAPNISLFGGARYIRVNYDEAALGTSEIRIAHRELQLGGRFMTPISPTAKVFVEGNLHSATITARFQGESNSESGVGFAARAGVMFMLDRKIGLSVAGSFSSADIEFDDSDEQFQDSWLAGDLGLNFFF